MQHSLFDWSPPCQIVLFPMSKRVGRIRSTAEKMLAKSTDRHADSYRDQVTLALINHLCRLEVPQIDQDKQVGAFWSAVDVEMIRQTRRGQRPGGNAA
ncbi:DUF6074 family protein [Mesorhizobium sp. M7A.F.Ca.US.008.03.1.1]|uniref:DUF6074 family protein n=1 Tax=Mesorhizobium sp. M7A.F.Ca.US.008.03.1.1 TaxID=2496742 RepID=UPI000FCAABA9|nr:DUF6074 family protein [Mesorhizobium sp. M7A.F.Ca.US.008.03.1.1]RUW62131.1 hypothetical protein EOA16_10370 [Mesorhizobium sp. M7A.F.Ca.US.008.03.1.1]